MARVGGRGVVELEPPIERSCVYTADCRGWRSLVCKMYIALGRGSDGMECGGRGWGTGVGGRGRAERHFRRGLYCTLHPRGIVAARFVAAAARWR